MLHGKFMDAYDGSTENPLLEIRVSWAGDADGRAGGSRGPPSLKKRQPVSVLEPWLWSYPLNTWALGHSIHG